MKKTVPFLTIMLSAILGFSQNFTNGLYLGNEGNFGTPNGDISFYDLEADTLYEDVFQTANPGEDGFDVLQDFKIFDSRAYFLSKSSSDEKLTIANSNDFTFESTVILDGAGPQSITKIDENKAYISCANAPHIRILDLETATILGSVGSSIGSFYSQDHMAISGSNAYVFMGDSIGIVDTDLDSAYSAISTENAEVSCSGMFIENDKLFVLTNSGWSGDESRLFRIDVETNTLELDLDLSTLGKARLLQSDGDNLYFMVGNEVYKMAHSEEIAPSSSFATSSYSDAWDLAYGKAFLVDPSSNKIYIGSAEGFAADGTYEVLSLEDGSELSSSNPSGGIGLSMFLSQAGALSIQEVSPIEAKVYPNPARDKIMIETEGNELKRITLLDGNGRVIKKMESSNRSISLTIDEFEQGIYFLRIEMSNKVTTERIVIHK